MICTNFPNLENRGVAANMPDAAKRALDLFVPPPHKGSAPHFLELARHRTSSGWLIKRFAFAPDLQSIVAVHSARAETFLPRRIGISPITSNLALSEIGWTPNKSSVVHPSALARSAHTLRKSSAYQADVASALQTSALRKLPAIPADNRQAAHFLQPLQDYW